MSNIVKAVIFDQDGLMFDTERLSVTAWNEVGKKYGISVEDSFFDYLKGGGRAQAIALMKDRFGPDFPCEKFLDEKKAYSYRQIEREGVPVKKGLKELLHYLKDHGCKTGVATASSRDWTQRNVKDAGIDGLFDTYTYGEMVSRVKPDPEIFLLAAKMLGEKPQECLVLEDSFNGLEAGFSGGFLTVMVPDLSFPGPELKKRLTAQCDSLLGVIDLFEQGFFRFG